MSGLHRLYTIKFNSICHPLLGKSGLIEEKAIEPADKPKIRAIIKQVKKYDAEKKTSKEEKNRDSVAFWESIISDEKSTIKERLLARANLDRLINQDNVENTENPETYAAKIRQLIRNGQAVTGASKFHFADDGSFDPILSDDGIMIPCPTQNDRDERDKKRAEAWLAKQGKNIINDEEVFNDEN